jgi:prephenate dehydrogenase
MTTSTPPVVLVGVGEMGGVFAKALLKKGHTVIPVIRSTSVEDLAGSEPEPTLVLVTVGEDDLDGVLSSLPASWKNRVALIQN